MPPEPIIRPYLAKDRAAVAEICHRTGYRGEDATPYFADRTLFAMIFALSYTDHEPEHCFVVDDGGSAVGYCVGTPDTQTQIKRYTDVHVPAILRHLLTRTIWRHPRDLFTVLRWKRMAEQPDEEHTRDLTALRSTFPAHLHIDIMPSHHRRGLGSRLLDAFLSHLEELGVSGLHLVTSTENRAAVPFYEAMGFKLHSRAPERMWQGGGPVESLTFTMELPRSG
jgi:ribosomal protein S18 acetylase RimI-like enzyme